MINLHHVERVRATKAAARPQGDACVCVCLCPQAITSHINTLTGSHPPTNPPPDTHTPEISNRRKKETLETVSPWVYPASFSSSLPVTPAFPPPPPLPSHPVSPTPTLSPPDPVADTRAQHISTLFSEKLEMKCCYLATRDLLYIFLITCRRYKSATQSCCASWADLVEGQVELFQGGQGGEAATECDGANLLTQIQTQTQTQTQTQK